MSGERQGPIRAVTSQPDVFTFFQAAISGDYRAIKGRLDRGFLVPGLRYLDVGCGTGTLFPFVRDRGCEYVGLDLDPAAIAFARRRFPEADFRVADARALAGLDHGCQRAFSVGLLHHLTGDEADVALESIASLLDRDGRYFVIDAAPPRHAANVIGLILRRLDTGAHIRPLSWYRSATAKHFRILSAEEFSRFPLDYVALELEPRRSGGQSQARSPVTGNVSGSLP